MIAKSDNSIQVASQQLVVPRGGDSNVAYVIQLREIAHYKRALASLIRSDLSPSVKTVAIYEDFSERLRSEARETGDLLQLAGQVAARMPRLERMILWNCRHDE
ncbi:hypothetical protein PG984_008210 [Apiospora sp. TS-2023a]